MPELYLTFLRYRVYPVLSKVFLKGYFYLVLFLTLQVLEGERHDAPCSSSSHQALDVGCG